MDRSGDSIAVLHVDDARDFADMAATFLEREDERFTVETAESAAEGLARLAESSFDCVVSDYDMPERNGIEFLEDVREEYPDLPFVLFTGKGSEEVASDAISAGATDYLQKESGTDQYAILANRIRNAVEQHRAGRRAAELDRIRTLASDVNRALVRSDTQDEIERRVCEIVSRSDPYRFAWIGGVDPETGCIEPRTSAGSEDGYLDDVRITVDGDDPTGRGPAGTAVRERRIAVSQNVGQDPEFAPWREEAIERGFRSAAAVPLEHGDTSYGLLVVYADRPNAFDDAERDLLDELGADVAHAIHSVDIRDSLRTERDRRTALFDNAPGPVMTAEIRDASDSLVVTDVNDAFTDLFGYEPEDILGTDPVDVMVPDDEVGSHEQLRTRVRAGETITTEVERFTTDGRRTFLLHLIPLGTDDGDADGVYAWFTDISDRHERERAIESLHTTGRTLMSAESATEVAEIAVGAVQDVLGLSASALYLADDSESRLEPAAWTDRVEELLGQPPTLSEGEGLIWDVFDSEEAIIDDDVSQAPERLNPDTEFGSEIILPLGGHGTLIIGSTEVGAFDEIDVSLAQTLAAHATTALERVAREAELREERAFIEQALDALNDVFYVLDPDGGLRRWNDRVPELTGYSEGEIADMDALDFFPEEDRSKILEAVEQVMETGEATLEASVRTADGERIPHEFTGARITDADGNLTGLVGIGRDVSERKQRERQLRRFETVLEEISDGVYILDADGHYIYVNSDVEETTGYDREELIGETPHLITDDDDVERCGAAIREMLAGERDTFTTEVEVQPKHGDPYPGEIKLTTITEDGELQWTVGIVRDITDRKERQRELQTQNERLEKFANVLSHDLRNPLSIATGHLELAREDCDSDALDTVANAHRRMERLIDDLLTLARQGETVGETEAVDLAALVDGCWANVDTADATLVTETDRSIVADPSRLKQLLENLIRNAVQHGGESVTVTVGDSNGGFYVADDGPGIPADECERVFEVGYSTETEGTGFGLNIVREIAEAHGWSVRVVESEDGGARFEVTGVERGP